MVPAPQKKTKTFSVCCEDKKTKPETGESSVGRAGFCHDEVSSRDCRVVVVVLESQKVCLRFLFRPSRVLEEDFTLFPETFFFYFFCALLGGGRRAHAFAFEERR